MFHVHTIYFTKNSVQLFVSLKKYVYLSVYYKNYEKQLLFEQIRINEIPIIDNSVLVFDKTIEIRLPACFNLFSKNILRDAATL